MQGGIGDSGEFEEEFLEKAIVWATAEETKEELYEGPSIEDALEQLRMLGMQIPATETAGEGALKFFLVGSISSAILLYGLSFLFGATGTTDIAAIAPALSLPHEIVDISIDVRATPQSIPSGGRKNRRFRNSIRPSTGWARKTWRRSSPPARWWGRAKCAWPI